ncbi:response regulator [Leucobacter sp. HY1908]
MSGGDPHKARIAIVEDHVLQRTRTEELLKTSGQYEVVFSGESAPNFIRWSAAAAQSLRPHLLILDLMVDRQPSVSPAHVEMMVKGGLKVLVLSALASPALVRQVIKAGAAGIVGKRDSEASIHEAVSAVLEGREWVTAELASVIAGDPERPELSVQEERALVLYASGLSIENVGLAMNISRETAKQYLDRVKKKYASVGVPVRSKLDFGRVAWADGYLGPSLPSGSPNLP